MGDKEIQKLQEQYKKMGNDKLIAITMLDKNDYTSEAVELAKLELASRNIDIKQQAEKAKIINQKRKLEETNEKLYHAWHWLLWWQISPEELEGQIENYNNPKITQSARGLSFLLCIASSIITLISIAFFKMDKMGFVDIVLFLVLGFFIYKGQRWAIIITMILWTMEKAFLIYEPITKNNYSTTPIQIVWWCLYMHVFYVALKVDSLRRRAIRKKTTTEDKKGLQ